MRPRPSLFRREALFAAACFCCVPARRLLAADAGPPQPARVTEVASGIYVRTGVTEDASPENADAIANIGFIVGRDAVAVIDPGGSLPDGESLRLAVRQVTQLPIRYVLLSHIHLDHIFGAEAFEAEKPVFIGHARLPEQLAVRGEFYRQNLEKLLGPGRAGKIVVPTMLVRDRTDIDLGGRVLELRAHQPAHTVCDVSVLDRNTNTLLLADLLFVHRVPVLDGDLDGWLAELAALKTSGSRLAVPGHGPPAVPWPEAALPLEQYLHVVRAETKAAIAKGVPIEDAATSVAASERGKWKLFETYNGRNVIEAYHKLEWE